MDSRRTGGTVPGVGDARRRFSRAALPGGARRRGAGGRRDGRRRRRRARALPAPAGLRAGRNARCRGRAPQTVVASDSLHVDAGCAPRASAPCHDPRAMAIVLALAAAASWGLADFLAGLASRRVSVPVVLLLVEGGGLVVIARRRGDLGRRRSSTTPRTSGRRWPAGCRACWASAASTRALAIGTMSVVAPISVGGRRAAGHRRDRDRQPAVGDDRAGAGGDRRGRRARLARGARGRRGGRGGAHARSAWRCWRRSASAASSR